MKHIALALALTAATPAGAAGLEPTLSDWGGVGLLQNPTARFLPDGTLFTGYTMLGPAHRHLFVGGQALPGLELVARQTLYPNLHGLGEPGLDIKLRLLREGEYWPEIAVGGRDVTGAGFDLPGKGRFAGEYLVLSRRWWNLDTSLGVGWGRFGGYAHMRNPLRFLGDRFRRDRDPALPGSRGPRAWFSGESVALFGGVEWHTPLPGLSLKLEYSGDSFRAEQRDAPSFTPGLPINAGLAYRALSWLDLGVGLEQGHRVMAHVAARLGPEALGEDRPRPAPMVGARPTQENAATPRDLTLMVQAAGLPARSAAVDGNRATLWLDPAGRDGAPSAREIGRTARLLADSSPPEVERLTVVSGARGLEGVAITLQRRDLERATQGRGSAEELWRTAQVEPPVAPPPDWPVRWDLALRPTVEQSLFEQGTPLVHRAYTDIDLSVEPWRGVLLGGGLRLNITDNLTRLDSSARPADKPVRSDLPFYARPRANLSRLYGAWMGTPGEGWHAGMAVGHLEEMFGGAGAELLYQPTGARWAAGFDLNHVWKRPAGEPLRLLAGSGRTTGHLNLHLEAPGGNTATSLRLGRYLGGDWGGTLELGRHFSGGVRLSAYMTWTEGPAGGQSRLGGRLEQGLVLTFPLGTPGRLPLDTKGGVQAVAAVRTLGRDAGQRLQRPFALYETLSPAGFGRLAGGWSGIMD